MPGTRLNHTMSGRRGLSPRSSRPRFPPPSTAVECGDSGVEPGVGRGIAVWRVAAFSAEMTLLATVGPLHDAMHASYLRIGLLF